MRKAYSAYFLVGFFALLFFPLAFGISNSASDQQNTTVTYYLNVNNVASTSMCSSSSSQNVLGSLDSNALAGNSAGLNTNAFVWNTFCTPVPVAVETPLTITSVQLTLYVCCGDGPRYAVLPRLIDNSTSPPTILASSGGPVGSSARGDSCQSPTKIGVNIPVNNNAMLMSGQVLVLQFQFGGPGNATLCTGSSGFPFLPQNTPSSITITGTVPLTTTSSTTTSETTSSSTTASTSTSTTTTDEATSSSTSASSTTTTSISTIQTSTDSSSLPPPTSTHSLSTTTTHSASTGLNITDPLVLSGLVVGLVVVASSVIALGGRRS